MHVILGPEDLADLLDDRVVKPPGMGLPPHLTGDLKELATTIQRVGH